MVFVDHEAADAAWKKTGSNVYGAATSGGHFVYDEQHMHAIAQKWDELADHYGQSTIDSAPMVTVLGPGAEYASSSHAVDANQSGSAYVDSLKTSRDYCRDQATKYRKVLGETVTADEDSHRKLQQPSSPLDGGL